MRRFVRFPGLVLALALVLVACVTTTVDPKTGDVIVTVCDFYGFPLAGAMVQLGNEVETVGADGTVTFPDAVLPYDLAVYDSIFNEVRVFFGLSRLDPGIVMPDSLTDAGAVNEAQVSGQFSDDFSSGNIARYVGLIVNDRPGQAQSAPPSFTIDAKWSFQDGPTADAMLYGLSLQYDDTPRPNQFIFPGEVTDFRGGLNLETLSNGGSITSDLQLSAYQSGTLSGTAAAIAGFDLVQRSYGFQAAAAGMTSRLPFQVQADIANGAPLEADFAYVSKRAPMGWEFDYFLEAVWFNNNTLGQIATTLTNLAFDTSDASLVPAFTTPPDVSGIGSSFGTGSEFDLGDIGNDTMELAFRPANTALPNLYYYADEDSFPNSRVVLPDLSPLGISLPAGEDFTLRLRRYSWDLETMASKLADVRVLRFGSSYRQDLTTGTSPDIQLVTE